MTADRVRQVLYHTSNEEKIPLLIGILNHVDPTRSIVFVNTKRAAERIWGFLEGNGFKFYVDAVALNYLHGVEIDYVTRETGATFVFNNVFQSTGGSGTCGATVSPGTANDRQYRRL